MLLLNGTSEKTRLLALQQYVFMFSLICDRKGTITCFYGRLCRNKRCVRVQAQTGVSGWSQTLIRAADWTTESSLTFRLQNASMLRINYPSLCSITSFHVTQTVWVKKNWHPWVYSDFLCAIKKTTKKNNKLHESFGPNQSELNKLYTCFIFAEKIYLQFQYYFTNHVLTH